MYRLHLWRKWFWLDMRPGRVLVGERFAEEIGTTSVVIRKNWNDTEKISMAPAQG